MTTNHPAHGPVSLDRLHQIREILSKAAAQSDGGNIGYAMADAVKVIDGAIAAFGAEPASYADPQAFVNFKSMGGKNAACTKEWMWRDPCNGLIPLYTAPPAPVVPEPKSYMDFLEQHPDMTAQDSIERSAGWNACRAAMLQSFGNSEQLDEVGSWNNHRNTPTAQAGNSPVTPDDWIPVSERMPNNCDGVFAWSGGLLAYAVEAYFDGSWYRTLTDEEEHHITHWMPLPAAPQQK
ncbi:DUF551 domain-containing protein [Citrobacter freundii]|uniref:DUF551 domain-containing protein n=1 Tax=Citrobacter freundii TaxID=546 RepID=UPI0015F7856A|nr:DUF551 domain-containing protein [Citrobacter freundii]